MATDWAALPHYVYTLSDPRDGSVFYVGKGSGNRAFAHERDVIAGRVSNAGKTKRIASILADGFRVVVSVVSVHQDEQDALDAEAEMIGSISGLTNIMSCGVPSGASISAVLRTADRIRSVALDDSRSSRREVAEFGALMMEAADALARKAQEMRR